MPSEHPIGNQLPRRIAVWMILAGMASYGTVALLFIIHGMWFSEDRWIFNQAKEHFAAVVGLPSSALAALFIVSIFEATTGPIEFEGFGFKFRGASGPIIFLDHLFLGNYSKYQIGVVIRV